VRPKLRVVGQGIKENVGPGAEAARARIMAELAERAKSGNLSEDERKALSEFVRTYVASAGSQIKLDPIQRTVIVPSPIGAIPVPITAVADVAEVASEAAKLGLLGAAGAEVASQAEGKGGPLRAIGSVIAWVNEHPRAAIAIGATGVALWLAGPYVVPIIIARKR
jgi:hypothetical protein